MDDDPVGAGLGERLEVRVDRRDHQVRVETFCAVWPDRADELRPETDVGDEMPVHHVQMDPVGPGRVDGADLLAKPCEVGGKDRRSDQYRLAHGGVSRVGALLDDRRYLARQ